MFKTFYSEASSAQKVLALRKACETHVKLTKECSQGLGQDRYVSLFSVCPTFFIGSRFNRHLYAMYCLVQRQLQNKPEGSSVTKMPSIYTDPGWALLGTSILSTSNCGNPALRLFGFGPVAADGYGIGYIIKEDGISVYVSFLPLVPSIHQTRVLFLQP